MGNIKEKKESKFQKIWSNPRKKAGVKLGLWGLFMIVIIGYASITSRMDTVDNKPKEEVNKKPIFEDIEQMKSNILDSNYSYEYNVTAKGIHYLFKGEKYDNKFAGYKETSTGIIKYYIEDEKHYSLTMNDFEELETIYDLLDENLLDLVYIFSTFSGDKTENINGEIRQIIYKNEISTLTITTNLEVITKLVIEYDDDMYSLKFDNLNKVKEVERPEILDFETTEEDLRS